MRLFLLGTGYVGMALLKGWEEPSVSFWASTTTASKLEYLSQYAEKAVLIKGSDEKTLRLLLADCDGMVIAAAPNSGGDYKETYLDTAKAVRGALLGRDKPFYLLYLGSTSVYGDHGGELVDETSECLNESEQGKILSQTEKLYLDTCSEAITPCIVRLGGIYGPGREMAARGLSLSGRKMGGTGGEPTNSIHLDDILRGIAFCICHRCKGIFNLVSGDHPTRKELYDKVCQNLGVPPPLWSGSMESLHGSNCIVSPLKISNLGFTFAHPFIEIESGRCKL